MTKKTEEKFKDFALPIPSTEVSANIKKILYSIFGKYGMSQSTTFLRIFSKGFDEWELLGVDVIKKDFLERHKGSMLLSESVDEDGNIIEGDDGYAAILAFNSDEPGGFYTAIKEAGLVKTFKEEMQQRGMSPHSAYCRFTEEEWKPWEQIGVKKILEEFIEAVKEQDEQSAEGNFVQ